MSDIVALHSPRRPRPRPEPLWRDVVGALLRAARAGRAETLGQVGRRAGVSPQYLSEIERGLKEPSSEVLAAVAGALDLTLLDLTRAVAGELAAGESAPAAAATRRQRAGQVLALAA